MSQSAFARLLQVSRKQQLIEISLVERIDIRIAQKAVEALVGIGYRNNQ
jgi:hypothetical protein